jgi:hypothetical protein
MPEQRPNATPRSFWLADNARFGREVALAMFLYAAVFAAALLGKGFSPAQHYFGEGLHSPDWAGYYWTGWAYRRVFLGQDRPFYCTALHHPYGFPTAAQHGHPLLEYAQGFLAWVFSVDAAHYLLALFAWLGNGLGGFLLARRLTRNRAAALLGGLCFMFNGYVAWAASAGAAEYASWLWIGLFLLFLDRTLADGRPHDGALAGGFFTLACLSNLAYAAPLSLFAAILAAFRWREARRRFGALAVAVVLAAALLSPLVSAFAREHGAIRYTPSEAVSLHAPTLKPLAPADAKAAGVALDTSHALNEYAPWRRNATRSGDADFYWALAALGLVGLVWRRRDAGSWLAAGGALFLFALGPYLQWWDAAASRNVAYDIPLPFLLAKRASPLLARIQYPERLCSFALIGAIAAAALGLDAAMRRMKPARQTALAVAALALTGAELLLYWPARFTPKPPINPFYTRIGAMRSKLALIEVPFNLGNFDVTYLYYQTRHGRPLFNGVYPPFFLNDPTRGLLFNNALLREIDHAQPSLGPPVQPVGFRMLAPPYPGPASADELGLAVYDLANMRFGYVVLHRFVDWDGGRLELPADSALPPLLEAALGPPVYADNELLAFALPVFTAAAP